MFNLILKNIRPDLPDSTCPYSFPGGYVADVLVVKVGLEPTDISPDAAEQSILIVLTVSLYIPKCKQV